MSSKNYKITKNLISTQKRGVLLSCWWKNLVPTKPMNLWRGGKKLSQISGSGKKKSVRITSPRDIAFQSPIGLMRTF